MPDLPKARLPQKPKGNKLQESWPDRETLVQELHVIGVKPTSGRVLFYTKAGEVLARIYDEKTARAVLEDAGLKFENFAAAAVKEKEKQKHASGFQRKTDSAFGPRGKGRQKPEGDPVT